MRDQRQDKIPTLTDQLKQELRRVYIEKDEAGAIAIDPAYLADEAMQVIDPDRASPELVSWAAVLSLRQLARSICGQAQRDEKKTAESTQTGLFAVVLQGRYPCHREGRDVYVKRDFMTRDEWLVNISSLANEAVAKQRHSDALKAEFELREARGDFDAAA